MGHCITRGCLTNCFRLVPFSAVFDQFDFVLTFVFLCLLFSQADWKPESPDKFGDIAELVKSVDLLKVEETKTQGFSFHLPFAEKV